MPFLAPLISGLLTGLAWLFRNRIGQWIVAALAWAGLAFATQTFAVEPWLDLLEQRAGNVGSGQLAQVALQWFGVMQFDKICTMAASAVVARFGMDSARAFLVKR